MSRAQYGKSNIYIVTFGSNAALLEILGDFIPSNRIFLDEQSIYRFSVSFFAALRKIRAERIDSLIDLEFFSCATAAFAYLSGAKKRVGYHRFQGGQNYRGDLFTHRLSYSHYLSVGESSWSMLQCLSDSLMDYPALPAISFPQYDNSGIFIPSESDFSHLISLLPDDIEIGDCIIVNPSLRDVLPLRAWPASYYNRLIKGIVTTIDHPTIIFTGRPDEYLDTEEFIKQFDGINAINLCGKTTLRDVFPLYSLARVLITSDSGPGHFASLTSIPTIVLFGPETPILYAPKAPNMHIMYKHLPCSPCYNVYNNRTSACTNNLCMKTITVEEVLAKAIQVARPRLTKSI